MCSINVGEWKINILDGVIENRKNYLPSCIRAFSANEKKEFDFSLKVKLGTNLEVSDNVIITKFEIGLRPYWVYKINEYKYLWVLKNNQLKNQIIYSISIDWKEIEILYDKTRSEGTLAFNYLGNIFAYSILNYGGIMLHGVIMEHKGKGIIISASSGIGKTTHARMWRDYKDALILNGDRALCRKRDGKWYAYGSPWCGSSGEYINRKVPIAAIVLLERGEINEVEKISPFEGALGLIPRAFAPTWEENLMCKALDTIDDIVKDIPVLKLKCRPDLEAVEVLEKAIESL